MIKANVILDHYKWKSKIKNPNNYFKKKLDKLNKIKSFKKKNYEFSVLLTNNKKMKSLNFKFRKKNKPTDVLSFPLYKDLSRILELNRDHEEDLGDMFINRQIVKKQAQIYEKSFVDELQYIIIHGLLHLVGYSHENEKELRKTEDKLMEVIWNGS